MADATKRPANCGRRFASSAPCLDDLMALFVPDLAKKTGSGDAGHGPYGDFEAAFHTLSRLGHRHERTTPSGGFGVLYSRNRMQRGVAEVISFTDC